MRDSTTLSTRAAAPASIVDLSRFRRHSPARDSGYRVSAELLSLRRSLDYEASVEIDELEQWVERFGEPVLNDVTLRVRRLMDREFGRLRVHRSHRQLLARHRSADALIAGMLRVQFHVQQIRMAATERRGGRVECKGVALTWGVGRSRPEAELERLRRLRQRKLSR